MSVPKWMPESCSRTRSTSRRRGLMAALFAALHLGLAELIETVFLRIGRWIGWAGAAQVKGLNQALMGCYRQPGSVARSLLWRVSAPIPVVAPHNGVAQRAWTSPYKWE